MNWHRLLSRSRLGLSTQRSSTFDARTEFQRDFDRIVFSSALRRLQDKTQVFPLAQNDYVRTRLTHSLEVASVGRTLGVMVGASIIQRHGLDRNVIHPQDIGAIVAAACLAHDIGNPPFGHAGEDAIRLWFQDSELGQTVVAKLSRAQQQDLLSFEGNAQGFRLLTRLQNPDNSGGMQLTCATLGAFSKYPRASWLPEQLPAGVGFSKFGFYQDDRDLFARLAAELALTPATERRLAWHRHPLAYLVEAADDICYLIIDIEDAFRLRRLNYQQASSLLLPLVASSDSKRLAGFKYEKEKIEFLRAKAIGLLIEQVHDCFMDHEAAILEGRFSDELLNLIDSANTLQTIKSYAAQYVYVAPEVIEVGIAGFEVLAALLQAFISAATEDGSAKNRMLLHLLPAQFKSAQRIEDDLYRTVLGITDFISGMTDTYAVDLYKKITGISLPDSGRGYR